MLITDFGTEPAFDIESTIVILCDFMWMLFALGLMARTHSLWRKVTFQNNKSTVAHGLEIGIFRFYAYHPVCDTRPKTMLDAWNEADNGKIDGYKNELRNYLNKWEMNIFNTFPKANKN